MFLAKQLREAGACNPFLPAPSPDSLHKANGILLETKKAFENNFVLPHTPSEDWQKLNAHYTSNISDENVYDCGHELLRAHLRCLEETSKRSRDFMR